MTPASIAARAALEFDNLAWPTPEDEAWRRTDLKRLLPKGFLDKASSEPFSTDSVAVQAEPLLPEGYAGRVITQGGRPVAQILSQEARDAGLDIRWIPTEDQDAELPHIAERELSVADRVTAWHWKERPGTLSVTLGKRADLAKPLVIEERSASVGLHCAPGLSIRVSPESRLAVVWSFEGDSGDWSVVNAGLTVIAEDAAKVDVTLRQSLGKQTVFFAQGSLDVGRDAELNFRESHLAGALVKTRFRATLSKPGSRGILKGLYVATQGRHIDLGTVQEHAAPHAYSDALYKGAVLGGGRTVFAGLIEVSPGAVGTDAYLTNKNLVLGEGGRADSIPQLDILTDDVKCSHGSTTGRINPEQTFYLTSRGFSPAEAEREITRGFLAEVLNQAPEAVSDVLSADLDAALVSLLDAPSVDA